MVIYYIFVIIKTNLLKHLFDEITLVLIHVVNLRLITGTLPDLKLSSIVRIKKSDSFNMEIPISL